jgi:hypothetical protein
MKILRSLNIDVIVDDEMHIVSKKLKCSKSELTNELLKLGLEILKVKKYKNLENIEREIILNLEV